ncbi:hypothetical protein C9374_011915 [Naegleria lovaniensis]|uniref:EGF-like domain-containing protein n=1 Tax=Naegleria lovaniensis TaxID=51637 RepID=A0AA88KEY4_NAELO|nr:uncharacterized protein C9374_011915 [Naegleria lovaniensis]KAG2373626.1 hypothetical protein C9374_011915 [Naegleria lovaniensis]
MESTMDAIVIHPSGDYLIGVQGQIVRVNPADLSTTVFTGTGGSGHAVNNVTALSAQYNNPAQIAVGTRYVYITDSKNYVVRQYDLQTDMVSFVYQVAPIANYGLYGGQIIKWTRSTNTSVVVATGLYHPLGITLTPEGNLFIADSYNHVIRKLFSNGTTIVFAGTIGQSGYSGDYGPATSARLKYPHSVLYNSVLNELYIVDRHNHVIRKVNRNGIIFTVAGNGQQGAPGYTNTFGPLLRYPTFLTFDSTEKALLITDSDSRSIRKLSIGCERGYVWSSNNSKCVEETACFYDDICSVNSSVTYSISNVMTNLESSLYGVAILPDSGDYIISVLGYVYRINPISLVRTVFTGTGFSGDAVNNVAALSAQYNTPAQLAVGTKYVYVADSKNYVIIKWTRVTNTSVVVATGLYHPLGITLTPEGNLFIADSYNHVIRKLFSNGTMIVFAGTIGQSGYSGDYGPATSARLQYPHSVAYHSESKEVYIVDGHNHVIRKVNRNGIITTVAGNGQPGAPGYLDSQMALFEFPVDISFLGSKPEFLITDRNNRALRKLTITCSDTNSYVLSSDFTECLPICFNKNSSDPTVCSGRGSCISPNYCSCQSNYTGMNCETHYCHGIVNSNSTVCSGHGVCSSHNTCTCNAGYYGNNCEKFDCNGFLFNSSFVCNNGNGICVAPDTCSCKTGYSGAYCQLYYCNKILFNNTSVCNGKGACVSPDVCKCSSPDFFGPNCDSFKCFGIMNTNVSAVCSGNGICTATNVCSCNTGPWSSTKYYGDQCQYHSCNGIPANSSMVCYSYGSCVAPDVCVCQPGRNGTFCDNPVCYGISADDTQKVCSARGTCLSPDNCACNTGYGGERCQYSICNGILSNSSDNETTNNDNSIIKKEVQVETLSNVTQLDSKNVTFDNFQTIFIQFPSNISKQISDEATSTSSKISLIVCISENVTATKEEVREVISPIVKIVLSKGSGVEIQVQNLTYLIEISFSNIYSMSNQSELTCVYFDEIKEEWSPEGIISKYDPISLTMKCFTSHLTSFAVIDMNFKKASNNPKSPVAPPPSFSIHKDGATQNGADSAAAIAATVSMLGSILVCGVVAAITVVIIVLTRRAKKQREV